MEQVYLALPFVQFIAGLFLAGAVVVSGARGAAIRLFTAFLVGLSAWGIAIFLMRDAFPDAVLAYSREKVALAVIPFSSIFFYHFVLILTGHGRRWRRLAVFYGLGVAAAALSLTGQTAIGMEAKFYGFAPTLGWAFPVVLLASYPPVVVAIFHLNGALRRTESPRDRGQLRTLRLGVLISVVGATSDFLPSLGLNVYPMGILGNIVFAGITTFAVTRYRLMNLRAVARQGLAYSLVSASVFAFYGVALLTASYLGRDLSLTARAFVIFAVVLLAGVFVQPGLFRLQAMVDRMFFRERSDRLRAVGRLNELTKEIRDIAALSHGLATTVREAVQADWTSLALPDGSGRELGMAADSRGDRAPFALPMNGAAAAWLRVQTDALRVSDVRVSPAWQSFSDDERRALDQLEAEALVPMASRNGFTGLLVLGPRLVGPGYTREDMEFLRTAAGQAAAALENARLFAASQREALERAALAELARVVSSTLEFSEVLRRCAEQVTRLVPCDRLTIATFEEERGALQYNFVSGPDVQGRMLGDEEPVAGSPFEIVVQRRAGIIIGKRSNRAGGPDMPVHPAYAAAGFQSAIVVPLLANDKVIGAVHFARWAADAYAERDRALAERVGALVANAVANSRLYAQALQLAEERERRAIAEAATRELQRVNEVKSAFLSTVSHELKTPLTSMMAFTDILLRNRSGSVGDRDAKHLEVIRRNGKRLTLLIGDLQDVSQLDTGQLSIEPVDFDMLELVKEVHESFQPILEAKSQRLAVSVPAEPLPVVADKYRMHQVMSNLLSNASKYSPPNAQIELQVSNGGGRVNVQVTDHGIGLSPEDQKKLFTSFFRANNTATRSMPGTGLGLVIVKGLIELHGGSINIESAPGEGTRVSFHILKQSEVKKAEPTAA